jgi:hypothetical protein
LAIGLSLGRYISKDRQKFIRARRKGGDFCGRMEQKYDPFLVVELAFKLRSNSLKRASKREQTQGD